MLQYKLRNIIRLRGQDSNTQFRLSDFGYNHMSVPKYDIKSRNVDLLLNQAWPKPMPLLGDYSLEYKAGTWKSSDFSNIVSSHFVQVFYWDE